MTQTNQSYIRAVRQTEMTSTRIEIEHVSDVLIDNRAIGYRAIPLGGRDSSFEPLAETIANYALEAELASALQNTELLAGVFTKIFPKKETFKLTQGQGMLTMPMLIGEFLTALGGDGINKKVLAHILAELTAHSLRALAVVLPFDGVLTLTPHYSLFPTAQDIIKASAIKRLTDVLESMKLDPEIGRVKTLSAASLYTAMAPVFVRAGRLILQTMEQDEQMKDTFCLLRMYVTQDPALPTQLRTNPDLEALASNLTLVLAAAGHDYHDIYTADFELRSAIANSALRIRELKRFSIKHLSEVKDWYVHYTTTDGPGQRITGLVFGRSIALENRPQATVFNQVGTSRSPMWTQTPFPLAENRLEPLLTTLFSTHLNTQSLASVVTGIATYITDRFDDNMVYFANGATEIELLHYAAACSRAVALTRTTEGASCLFINEDAEMNYYSKSQILGTIVASDDPAEGVIHSGLRENIGAGYVPTRVQGIPDTSRMHLLLDNPEAFTVSMSTPIAIDISFEDEALSVETSLAQLLALPQALRLSLTVQPATYSLIQSHVELLTMMADKADITATAGQVGRLRAAMSLSNLLLAVGASPAGRAVTRGILLRMTKSVQPDAREKLRGQLSNAAVSYRAAITVGAQMLVATSMLDARTAEAALSLIAANDLDRLMIGSAQHLSNILE